MPPKKKTTLRRASKTTTKHVGRPKKPKMKARGKSEIGKYTSKTLKAAWAKARSEGTKPTKAELKKAFADAWTSFRAAQK
jgi:hypothetical protein